jgi:diadenosine tetraphosphate (Ap4A) HIT family hydrolase
MSSPSEPAANSSSSSPDPTCQFCQIASAYPAPSSSNPTSWITPTPSSSLLPFQNHTILSTPHVLAFLDYYRINPGHLLLIPREHHARIAHLPSWLARDLGAWLPLLSRVLCRATGVEDWNIAQNNGVLAKQTVHHIHFHLVPRPAHPKPKSREQISWARVMGHEAREDFSEAEGEEMAERMREELRAELERMGRCGEKL